MTAGFELHEVSALIDSISRASRVPARDAAAVVDRGALNIKRDAAQRIKGLAHARAYPRAITYDSWAGLKGPVAEIGPDKTRPQGALGNLLEYGSVNNPPHPHMRPAADAEEPRFAKAIEELAVKALGLE